ncbi:hypothetical protein GCM10023084_62450 [Streptomyces lacrimifluminis]|uniref:Uncharacterized protein n=1 Tax=Streptomyces lacrimifluminis TaxID=1500077 RepID=A0A917L2L8_9ACTN|nr:hypothetical protein [Streptomyces lacrimifluminis]GGJ42087.1 hypothetical protein GCM10012282_43500 [Streptomyces lacrimifluminis]
MAGRGTLRINTDEGRGTRASLYQDRRQYVWNNDRDTATLRNDHDHDHRHGGARR